MKSIIEKYIRWQMDHPDEEYQYDMIHEFFNMLSRSEMYNLIEFAESEYHLNQ